MIRTKQILAASLEKLLKTRTLDKITVKDIVEEAGVNRQTFYYHFQDVYALIEWIFEQKTEGILADVTNPRDLHENLDRLVSVLQDERDLMLNTFRSIGRESLFQYIFSEIEQLLRPFVDSDPAAAGVSEEDRAFLLDFYCAALVGQLEQWLRSGMKGEPGKLARQVSRMMDGEIHRTLVRFAAGEREKN